MEQNLTGDLVRSMNEVCQSSDPIRGTAKVIDEFAFQADLLALNAAVETARGRAGRPLLLLAEEVRTLSQGRAEAARGPDAPLEEPCPGGLDGGEQLHNA